MTTKAIFWDNDGVLVDTERLYYAATKQVLATVGVSLTLDQYIELLLVQGKGAFHLAAEKGVTLEGVEKLRDERNAVYAGLLETEPIAVEGAREALETLGPRYLMGVVTSSRPDHFAIIHERTGFLKHFRFVIASGDYARSKPHPDPYLLALERSGFSADECIVVEDSARGLAAAKAAGIRCVVVPNGFTRASDFTGAYRVLKDLPALVDLLG
jgi:HAD superfamily hydrolase (TIGR01509 family)